MHHVKQLHTIQIVKNHRYDLRLGLLRVLREARKNMPPPIEAGGVAWVWSRSKYLGGADI